MDFNFFEIAWLIPFFPLLVFGIIALFAHRSRAWSQRLAIGGIVVSALLALLTFLAKMLVVIEGQSPAYSRVPLGEWFSLGGDRFLIGIHIDQLNALMLPVLALACLVIFIYSAGAMRDDPCSGRFFALLSLLASGVLGLLIFDNLLFFIIFWVLMDACAYLLTGFWHEQESVRRAALKVFLVTGAGDLFLLLGIALLWMRADSLSYSDVFSAEKLAELSEITFLDTQFSVVTVVALLFFGGVMVKSGQFPLHVWLPEAAEAPAPASALIHAATASAGVFLLIRAFPLLNAAVSSLLIADLGLTVVTLVGVFTAGIAALIAATQRDMRRALSFSAIGQLGYAIAALGIGAYVAGVFHLVTGIFFNMLLFLAAGSVLHGMKQGSRDQLDGDSFDPNDMLNMGGLAERQPITFYLFLAGGAALAGAPFVTAGFWSKDAILAWAWANNETLFWSLTVIAAVTSFGMMRQISLIFAGGPRSHAAARSVESVPAMTTPLIFLTLFVLVLGWIGVPISGDSFIAVFLGVGEEAQLISEPTMWWSIACVAGLSFGFMIYAYWPARSGEMDWVESMMRAMWLGWLYEFIRNALYVDALYQWVFARPAIWLGRGLTLADDVLDDLIINAIRGFGRGPALIGGWFDAHVLTPFFRPVDRVAEPVAQGAGWVDVWLGVPADQLPRVGKYPALVAGWLDLWMDRLVTLTEPATLILTRLSAVIDHGLDITVRSVGKAVRMGGLWFRPKTGNVQDYLRLAAVTVVVLAAMFLLFIFV
jgi:NADH-quinone oxidoreductase subunit L